MQVAVYSFQMEPRAGPASGGTQILVHGTNLAGGDNYKCKFDGIVVPAWFKFSGGNLGARHWWRDNWVAGPARGVGSGGAGGGRHGQITCFAPPALKPGPVHFCISIDGRTWTCDQYQKSYYYYESTKKTQDKKIKSSFTSLPSGGEQLVISI